MHQVDLAAGNLGRWSSDLGLGSWERLRWSAERRCGARVVRVLSSLGGEINRWFYSVSGLSIGLATGNLGRWSSDLGLGTWERLRWSAERRCGARVVRVLSAWYPCLGKG